MLLCRLRWCILSGECVLCRRSPCCSQKSGQEMEGDFLNGSSHQSAMNLWPKSFCREWVKQCERLTGHYAYVTFLTLSFELTDSVWGKLCSGKWRKGNYKLGQAPLTWIYWLVSCPEPMGTNKYQAGIHKNVFVYITEIICFPLKYKYSTRVMWWGVFRAFHFSPDQLCQWHQRALDTPVKSEGICRINLTNTAAFFHF